MTNGIAISRNDPLARDYWLHGTCCSGYSFTRGSVVRRLLEVFIENGKTWDSIGGGELWKEYSSGYTLAVPEQLVWWEDE